MAGISIRQSDLESFSYCAQQLKLTRELAERGWRRPVLSATASGSVFHYAAMVLLKRMNEGHEDALEVALATFERYWEPDHIAEITEGPVDEWISTDTWGGMKRRHMDNLRSAHAWAQKDKGVLLALEHTFDVPFEVDGEVHTLHGTVDMLKVRKFAGGFVLGIDDWKTWRRRHYELDQKVQGTLYAYASLQREFWAPFFDAGDDVLEGFGELAARLDDRGLALYPGFSQGADKPVLPRRFRIVWAWDGVQPLDGGERTPAHYERLRSHVREYVKAVRAGVYPLTTEGSRCTYCPFNRDLCPLPAAQPELSLI